jgi:hypothetical protein
VTGRLGGGHSIADQCESSAPLLLIELWSAGVPSFRAGGGHAVAGSLGNQPSFELCGMRCTAYRLVVIFVPKVPI